MRESTLERHLVRAVQAEHGVCWKWSSPGITGVPDRICIMPGGIVIFVELKTPTGRLSPRQKKVIQTIKTLQANVRVVYSKKDIDLLMSDYRIGVLE
ncbi:VRR-NUC domain-containing protein [Mobiluncus mulieris]